jgi:hypothetical protein
MPTEQLQLIEETLSLPKSAVQFTAHGLHITAEATDTQLIDIGNRLFAAKGYLRWALGSLFAAMLERKRDDGVFSDEWLSEWTQAHHLDPKEKRELLGVFTFYRGAFSDTQPGHAIFDVGGLTYEHYREAMWGVSDGKPAQLPRAIAYLKRAREGSGMSVTQLRRAIREEHATDHAEGKQAEFPSYGVVFEFRRFCARELDSVADYTPERARLIIADLGESTLSYLAALREIAGDAPEAQP